MLALREIFAVAKPQFKHSRMSFDYMLYVLRYPFKLLPIRLFMTSSYITFLVSIFLSCSLPKRDWGEKFQLMTFSCIDFDVMCLFNSLAKQYHVVYLEIAWLCGF